MNKYAYSLGLAETLLKYAAVTPPALRLAATRYLQKVRQMEDVSKRMSLEKVWQALDGAMDHANTARRAAHNELIAEYSKHLQSGGKRLFKVDPLDRFAVGDMAAKIVKDL